ncbi:MAG: lactoylglutathione lyase [Spirochaetaceae bacterium]|nr:MAG: lactoylglutathione lyase [Spirochaetaceae bacterium]
MKANRIFETVLYASDLEKTQAFYGDLLGLEVLVVSELVAVFQLPHSMLLVFDPDESGVAGRAVPSHGARGSGHIAFAATDAELDEWIAQFDRNGYPIEKIHPWETGGRSVYLRDPAGNSVEFAPATLWGGNWNF